MLDVPPLWYKSKKSRYFQQIAPLTSGNVNHSTTEWHYRAAQGRSLYTTVNSYNARSPAIDVCNVFQATGLGKFTESIPAIELS